MCSLQLPGVDTQIQTWDRDRGRSAGCHQDTMSRIEVGTTLRGEDDLGSHASERRNKQRAKGSDIPRLSLRFTSLPPEDTLRAGGSEMRNTGGVYSPCTVSAPSRMVPERAHCPRH